jgi:hypothetical protein
MALRYYEWLHCECYVFSGNPPILDPRHLTKRALRTKDPTGIVARTLTSDEDRSGVSQLTKSRIPIELKDHTRCFPMWRIPKLRQDAAAKSFSRPGFGGHDQPISAADTPQL